MVTIMRRLAPIPQAILLQREELAKDKGFIPFTAVDHFASPDWAGKGATTEIDPAMNQSRFEELYGCNFKSENDGR